jgi:hypothetical protein
MLPETVTNCINNYHMPQHAELTEMKILFGIFLMDVYLKKCEM